MSTLHGFSHIPVSVLKFRLSGHGVGSSVHMLLYDSQLLRIVIFTQNFSGGNSVVVTTFGVVVSSGVVTSGLGVVSTFDVVSSSGVVTSGLGVVSIFDVIRSSGVVTSGLGVVNSIGTQPVSSGKSQLFRIGFP